MSVICDWRKAIKRRVLYCRTRLPIVSMNIKDSKKQSLYKTSSWRSVPLSTLWMRVAEEANAYQEGNECEVGQGAFYGCS